MLSWTAGHDRVLAENIADSHKHLDRAPHEFSLSRKALAPSIEVKAPVLREETRHE
jgi:hypothetical protein